MKNGKVSKMVEPAVLFAKLSPRGKTKKQFLLGLAVQAKGSCADLNRAGWENGASQYFSIHLYVFFVHSLYNCIVCIIEVIGGYYKLYSLGKRG